MTGDSIGFVILVLYYVVFLAIIPVVLKVRVDAPPEIVRKFQHVAYALSIFLLLDLFSSWYIAIGAASALVVVAYPVLYLTEKTALYKRLLVERRSERGELRRQLLLVQLSFAILILIFWGVLGTHWQYLAGVAVMGWGFGDAAAALVGKALGRRRIIHSMVEGAKTREGTLAMIICAGTALFLSLIFYGGLPWHTSLVLALIVAPVCGIVELFSRRGVDTITVPLAAGALLLPLIYLFSLVGWASI
jgi:phytol kinase